MNVWEDIVVFVGGGDVDGVADVRRRRIRVDVRRRRRGVGMVVYVEDE